MSNTFEELGIITPILKALTEMGFETPTPVQKEAIPHILNQKDLTVMSKTGSGKTAVYGVSMLQMIDSNERGPQGLVLVPTRELAVQVENDLKLMAKHTAHKTTAVYGQHNIAIEKQALEKGPSIVSGTPGRVFDHIKQGNLITKNIRFFVLDEADRMLDMGFIDQVVRIIKELPKNRITLLFSATIPYEVKDICQKYMKEPITIEIESPTMTVDTIEQLYYRVEHNQKRTWLNNLLLMEKPQSCLIFCNTRMTVDRVHNFLLRKGYASQALHGDIPQSKRLKTMGQFKHGQVQLLVATDVAARGIHVDDLSLVINYDVPGEKDSYVHRIGRTGRAGNEGKAISLVTSDDIMSLYEIEEHIGAMIEEKGLPSAAEVKQSTDNAREWIKAHAHNFPMNNYMQRSPYRKNSAGSKKPNRANIRTYNQKTPATSKPKSQSKVNKGGYNNKPEAAGKRKTSNQKVTTSIMIGSTSKSVGSTTTTKASTNMPSVNTNNNVAAQEKQSLLKRLVNRIFTSK